MNFCIQYHIDLPVPPGATSIYPLSLSNERERVYRGDPVARRVVGVGIVLKVAH